MRRLKDSDIILNRLDRIPTWPYPISVLIAIGAGFFFACFDVVSIGLALPKIEQQFNITAEIASAAVTSGLIGYIIGSFLDSRLSDYRGRKIGIYLSVGFFSVGSFFCAFSQSFDSLIFWRAITGMGLGAEVALVSTLMSELAPARVRGQYTAKAIAFGMLGFACIPFIALLLIPHYTWGWRALFLIGGLGGIIIAFMRRIVPESPRWLIAKGKIKEAELIVSRAEAYAEKKLKVTLPPPEKNVEIALKQYSFSEILKSPYLQRLILFTSIWFIYYLGNYAWLTLSTNLFFDKGFLLTKSISFVAISSIGFIVGSIFPVFYSDRIERKKLAAIIAIIWAIALLIIGWFPTSWVILLFGFIASTTIAALIPVMYTYSAENFPTSIRATCVSVTDGLGHLGGAICGQVIFGIYALFQGTDYGFAAAFSCMALTGLIVAFLVMLGKKMTKQKLCD